LSDHINNYKEIMAENKGQMTVREAGRKGGKRGGQTTKKRYGRAFYSDIGTKGGRRVKELIETGKEAEHA
jgi:general stress protein YciG